MRIDDRIGQDSPSFVSLRAWKSVVLEFCKTLWHGLRPKWMRRIQIMSSSDDGEEQ